MVGGLAKRDHVTLKPQVADNGLGWMNLGELRQALG